MYWRIDLLSILLLLRISKPYLAQAGRSTRVATESHTCKNGGYRYFKCFCPAVISSLNPLSEY